MKRISVAIGSMVCSFLSAMTAVLNYVGAFEVQYGISYAETLVKGIVSDLMSSRYLPEQSRSFYVRYVRFGRLITKNDDVLSLI